MSGITHQLLSLRALTWSVLQNCRGDRRTYHVSGVALYGPWDRFLMVPRRRDEVIMGDPHQTPEKFVEAYVSSLEYDCMDFNPCGYAVHERCWVLMARVIDVRLVKKNLDLFVKALCQRKQERIYELDKKICEEGQWDILEHEYGDKFVKNPRKYLRSYEKNMECSDTVFSERDPLNIPEVRKFIDKAASKKKKRRQRRPRGKKNPCTYPTFFLLISSLPFWTFSNTTRTSRTCSRYSPSGIF